MEGPIRDDMTPEFTISAYDPATGDLVWQQRTPMASAIGASGNLVTSGVQYQLPVTTALPPQQQYHSKSRDLEASLPASGIN